MLAVMRALPCLAFSLIASVAFAQDQDAAPAEPKMLVEAVNAMPGQAKFDRPLLVEFTATDPGTAYVVSQSGFIYAVPRQADAKERTKFADLSDRIYTNDNWEEGLLGFAFDPDYAQNGYVYVSYSEKTPQVQGEMYPGKKAKSTRQSVIARYGTKVQDGVRVLDKDTELRNLIVFQPFGNHNGGTIVFGPDKMLYIALGDGGLARDPFNNGQTKASLLGKVLRIDVRGATKEKPYAIPEDNPFVKEEGARGEVWCYGLRNPWRISFDRANGDLWCGDVGQDRIEEVNRLVKGGNYGWNVMEASEVFKKANPMPTNLIAPIAEYRHPSEGLSVTGGYVYRGKAIPEIEGCFVYGDFSTFRIWCVQEDRQGGKHQVREIGRAPSQLSSWAEEPDGELLMTCFDGKVYRLSSLTAKGK
jgi:glucose/arabinose dehydrogenase